MGNACSGMQNEQSINEVFTHPPPIINEEGHIEKYRLVEDDFKPSYTYFGKMESLIFKE